MKYLTKLKQEDVSNERLISQSCWKENHQRKTNWQTKKPKHKPKNDNQERITENASKRAQNIVHELNVFQPTVYTNTYFDLGYGSFKYYSNKQSLHYKSPHTQLEEQWLFWWIKTTKF